ncbi:S24/S26 family peptidase [Psychrosphaera saromensis]|uniref:Peptidase S24/S26A/S26B/S26C domain-containing protein n=1 Tax=Psychrosphaera saromensis TaxID=716813 RepID=A0A2S7V0U8_9GAMM|nr:S24/S26 family peptidase [Psychrosphaera saromensis]PQJ55160.1 hypothetical protein BTO11_04940 [Psychrosphaera saromensis]
MLNIIKVQGNSMLPELTHGDFVVVSKLYRTLNVGDMVVAEHSTYACIIKRITQISKVKGLLLSGDNKSSISSHQIGWVSKDDIWGKVRLKVKS